MIDPTNNEAPGGAFPGASTPSRPDHGTASETRRPAAHGVVREHLDGARASGQPLRVPVPRDVTDEDHVSPHALPAPIPAALLSDRRVGHAAMRVACALWMLSVELAGGRRICAASRAEVARAAGVSVDAVDRALHRAKGGELVVLGWVADSADLDAWELGGSAATAYPSAATAYPSAATAYPSAATAEIIGGHRLGGHRLPPRRPPPTPLMGKGGVRGGLGCTLL